MLPWPNKLRGLWLHFRPSAASNDQGQCNLLDQYVLIEVSKQSVKRSDYAGKRSGFLASLQGVEGYSSGMYD